MNVKILAIIVAAAVCISAAGGYLLLSNDGEADIVLSVGTKNCYEPFWIADGMGYFDEEGVKVKINYVDGGGNATTQLLSGDADMTLVGADPAIRLFDRTDDGVAVATIETAKEGESQDFAYLEDKGIDVNDPQTLLNKDGTVRIFCGVDTTTGYFSGYLTYLYDACYGDDPKITKAQYEILKTVNDGSNGGGIVHIPFNMQVAALQDGSRIQMICSGTNVQLAGSFGGIATGSSESTVVSSCVVIVTGDALENKRDAVAKMLRAFDKACAYIENPGTRRDAIEFCTAFYGTQTAWTEEMQSDFFDTQYWDICMVNDVEGYLNFKAELLGHENFDCSGRIVYDFLTEMHPDGKFIFMGMNEDGTAILETYDPE